MRRVGTYKGIPLIAHDDDSAPSLLATTIRASHWVPRGQMIRVPGQSIVYVHPGVWWEIFPPPGWSRYTAGARESRRDRALRARKSPIVYTTP